jgi:hypothetical protein
LQDIREKRLNTEKILQEEEEENTKLKATIEKLIRIREENAKLKQQIANMEYEQKKTHDKTNRPSKTFTTNFIDIDENISLDERSKRFLIVRNGPTQNKKRKRRRRNKLGRRSIKPN